MTGKGLSGALCSMFLGLAMAAPLPAVAQVDTAQFLRREQFREMRLSPDGTYLAATLPLEDRTGLVVMRLSDMEVTARFSLGRNSDIAWFRWVNPQRVLLGVASKLGMLAAPQVTGEIVGVDADGSNAEMLVGQRVQGDIGSSRLQQKRAERVWAQLVDTLPGDDTNVVLTVAGFDEDAYTRAERMDVRSGRRVQLASVPVRRAGFATDHQGVVRFASGAGADNVSKLYYRAGEEAEWRLVNDEARSGIVETPVGFSADGTTAYLVAEREQGPDAIVAWDVATERRTEVLRDGTVDPDEIIYASSGVPEPIGAVFMDGAPRTGFFNADHPDARLQRALEQAFEGERVRVVSRTDDGRSALLLVTSDRNSGDFFLFDTVAKKAKRLASRREWLDPLQMAQNRPVSFAARDGLPLHGYLTLPKGSDGKRLPLVLLPHGGPYEIKDDWEFADEAQLLAAAGYAVLRVNFRGSGGYGRAFTASGARQWGRTMQDDLTDATQWAIREGIADRGRICIYGASYGAYAALMGVAREPSLYRCAAGYVGVYDLVTRNQMLASRARSAGNWAEEWLGTDTDALRATSPNRLAGQIRVPVFLAAGGEDEIAPIEHTRMMEAALKGAGVPVESLYYATEGHGFYTPAHQQEYYARLLDFLATHLGGKRAR